MNGFRATARLWNRCLRQLRNGWTVGTDYRQPAAGFTDSSNGSVTIRACPETASCHRVDNPQRVKARSVVAYLAVRQLGMDGTTVGKRLGVGQSAISRAVARGEALASKLSIILIDE